MKKITILLLFFAANSFAQFTTGTVNLTATRTIKIDTNASTVTMTLTGPNTRWLGIGFGGTSMSTVTDMFIWNSTANRDYTPSGFQSAPTADALAQQSWTITSDTDNGTIRTIVATRPLVSAGDFTFLNDTSSINIIYNQGTSTALAYHGNPSERGFRTLTRTVLGVEDFSLNTTQIFPNPSNGNFTVKTKSGIEKINVYSHVGAFVKTIMINNSEESEINIKEFSSGVYLLELINGNERSWKKIIIN